MSFSADTLLDRVAIATGAPHRGVPAPRERVRVYPVMDGFYAAALGKTDMLRFLRIVFSALGEKFNATEENRFRFLVRGSYRDSIPLGMPMVQAHASEAEALPFGLCAPESARAFAPAGEEPLHDRWWHWDEFGNDAVQRTWATLHPNFDRLGPGSTLAL